MTRDTALRRACAIGRDAAATGFDWPDIDGVLDKVLEEHRELLEAMAGGRAEEVEAEFGDLLLALTNLARHLELDPESALDGASDRFEARFREVGRMAEEQGTALSDLSLDELEALWQKAKQSSR